MALNRVSVKRLLERCHGILCLLLPADEEVLSGNVDDRGGIKDVFYDVKTDVILCGLVTVPINFIDEKEVAFRGTYKSLGGYGRGLGQGRIRVDVISGDGANYDGIFDFEKNGKEDFRLFLSRQDKKVDLL